MFAALANMAIRHPVRMALMALAMFIVAVVFGATAPGLLNAQNPFSDPSSASFRAEAQIQRATGKEVSPGVVALVPAPPGSAEVTAVAQAIRGVPGVVTVTAPVPVSAGIALAGLARVGCAGHAPKLTAPGVPRTVTGRVAAACGNENDQRSSLLPCVPPGFDRFRSAACGLGRGSEAAMDVLGFATLVVGGFTACAMSGSTASWPARTNGAPATSGIPIPIPGA